LPAGFVPMLSKSGNFSRWARLYKFAIALLIYQKLDENPANASAGNKSGERFSPELLLITWHFEYILDKIFRQTKIKEVLNFLDKFA